MILIFDLDDTLYPEITFVQSGFREVANQCSEIFGLDKEECFHEMMDTLKSNGRGAVFDTLLRNRKIFSKKNVWKLMQFYRQHTPNISIPVEVKKFLKDNTFTPMYIVTDGHKCVQKNKIDALKIEKYFKKIFITHRFGLHHSKPSTYCFKLIKEFEQSEWEDMVYIGDNPVKDFINLNKLGMQTIRILSGNHANLAAKPGFNAKHTINTFNELPNLINEIFR
jgi:putative hydrolase of the HAD superfamily